ncbi:MAG: HIRAN domain-containing protein [Janthinobacterium lividum]
MELMECRPGDPIRLVRQPDNPHDRLAVAIVTGSGTCVGYLSATAPRGSRPRSTGGMSSRQSSSE